MAEVLCPKNEFINYKKLLIVSIILCSPMLFMVIIWQVKSCCVPFDLGNKSSIEKYMNLFRYKTMFLKDWRFQLILAAPMQFIIGSVFYKNSFLALRPRTFKRVFNRDSLIAIATTILFFHNLYIAFFGFNSASSMKDIHFERAMFVLTIALFGKYIENTIQTSKRFSIIFHKEKECEMLKLPLQKLTDKAYTIAIPITFFIAFLTFVVWYFFIFNGVFYFVEKPILYASSVLIVVYPWTLKPLVPLKSNLSNIIKRKIILCVAVLLIYNIAGIYLAITAHLTPEIAAIAMILVCILIEIQFIIIDIK